MNFQTFKTKTKAFVGKHGTDIACYGGCTAIGIGVFFACRATLKINEMAKKDAEMAELIKEKYAVAVKERKDKNGNHRADNGNSGKSVVLSKEGRKALTKHYVNTAARYGLACLPAAFLIGGGIAANIFAHRKEKSGRLEMTGIAMGAMTALSKYRRKFAEEHGEDAEKKFYYGVEEKEKEVVDEKGKKKVEKEEVLPKDVNVSDFAKFFGKDYSDAATGYPEEDLIFLKNLERSLTRRLARDKWLTLNDCYKAMCLIDAAGQRYGVKGGNNIGWVYDKDHPENNIINFGLYNLDRTENKDYINGYNDVILVEPNVNCLDLSNALWGLDMKTPDPLLFKD